MLSAIFSLSLSTTSSYPIRQKKGKEVYYEIVDNSNFVKFSSIKNLEFELYSKDNDKLTLIYASKGDPGIIGFVNGNMNIIIKVISKDNLETMLDIYTLDMEPQNSKLKANGFLLLNSRSTIIPPDITQSKEISYDKIKDKLVIINSLIKYTGKGVYTEKDDDATEMPPIKIITDDEMEEIVKPKEKKKIHLKSQLEKEIEDEAEDFQSQKVQKQDIKKGKLRARPDNDDDDDSEEIQTSPKRNGKDEKDKMDDDYDDDMEMKNQHGDSKDEENDDNFNKKATKDNRNQDSDLDNDTDAKAHNNNGNQEPGKDNKDNFEKDTDRFEEDDELLNAKKLKKSGSSNFSLILVIIVATAVISFFIYKQYFSDESKRSPGNFRGSEDDLGDVKFSPL